MTTIYVIRHAEKPDGTTRGVNEEGLRDPSSLTPRGWQRAGALATFFGSETGLPSPDRIYVSAPAKERIAPHVKIGSASLRPLETVTPLAAKLKKLPNKTYGKGDEPNLVKAIMKNDGTVLVCWQHEAIPKIAGLIIGSGTKIPEWPGDRFDVVWCFSRPHPRTPWTFKQVCQCLLAGDKRDAIT